MLQLKNIVKNYDLGETKVEALKSVNVEFRQNEFVAVLGPSGCGKTTLLNIIGGLDRYTSGDLIIDGVSTKNYKDSDWDSYRNHSIGFVFQTYNLIPHLNVLGNVELSLAISGMTHEERKAKAIEVLERVGLHDQIYKKPNQMSGGQMQRVAIARALVNNPRILLADEPTGALDSETSVQIMELLKEVAQDRLVIMVTHNPDLAKTYANRTIKLLDGEITSDSNPHTSVSDTTNTKESKTQKTSMSFLTALNLSLRNLFTKKARTILTAFAGSIGIIGIALISSLSNGFDLYIKKMQRDTISSYPLIIAEESYDFESLASTTKPTDLPKFPEEKEAYVLPLLSSVQSMIVSNKITDNYLEYVKKLNPELYYEISYNTGLEMNVYTETQTSYTIGDTTTDITKYTKVQSNQLMQELLTNQEFINSQYDILAGKMPTETNEVVLVVDQYNQISDIAIMSLGLSKIQATSTGATVDTEKPIDFNDILGHEFVVVVNNNFYTHNELFDTFSGREGDSITEDIYKKEDNIVLKISGIIRTTPETSAGSITKSIGYLPALTQMLRENAKNSEIVNWMKENPNLNYRTGLRYVTVGTETDEMQMRDDYRKIGALDTVSQISIYPVDFNAKDDIKDYLDGYNKTVGEEEQIVYTDVMAIMMSAISTAINAISYVLIAFTSISLVVSSIMIGIITYISVLERTKEIGVLRSIGARKKDISRVFNAETIIVGFVAGVMGIVISYILSFPINAILEHFVDVSGISQMNWLVALALIVISIILTLISGIIPSRVAAKKDPVLALRSE